MHEILCPSKIKGKIEMEICSKLKEIGYLNECENISFQPDLKNAVIIFQNDNLGLAEDVIYLETIYLLGIKIDSREQ